MLQTKNKDALLALGKIYYSGLDGKVDYTKALSLFEQAEHEGAAKGALWLSWMYYNGLGSPVDCNKAVGFYEKGAGLNDQKYQKMNILIIASQTNGVEKAQLIPYLN